MIINEMIMIINKIAKTVKMVDRICLNNRNTSPANLQTRNTPNTVRIEPP